MSKWRNYKHWIFDENDNHVIWPEQDNMSEKLAEMIVEQHNQSLSHLYAVNEKLVDAARKVVAHYEFVHRGMPVSTGVYLIGKLEEAVKLADEMGDNKQQ